jgi:hypothetical protein
MGTRKGLQGTMAGAHAETPYARDRTVSIDEKASQTISNIICQSWQDARGIVGQIRQCRKMDQLALALARGSDGAAITYGGQARILARSLATLHMMHYDSGVFSSSIFLSHSHL